MKNILIFLFSFIFLIGNVSANSIDFYWDKYDSWNLGENEILEIKSKIDYLQNKTWLNTDVVILWKKDNEWCYLQSNFDSCVKDNYWYSSDIIITLKMKSDISDRWDIRSYMDNKNFPIITTDVLKSIQDSIVYNFGWNNFKEWIIEYYNNLDSKIRDNCKSLKSENIKLWWDLGDSWCKINELKVINEANIVLREKAKKDASLMLVIYILSTIIIFIIFMVGMHSYYLWRLKKVLNDIKFQLLNLDKNKTFEKDSEKLSKDLELVIKNTQLYLADADKIWIKVRKHYLEISKIADKIKFEYEKSVKNYREQEKLHKEVEDFKNINI